MAVRGARNALADRVKILLDMNLSPSWIACLESGGHSAVHWSSIGSPSALDTEIMAWARENRYTVFTNDLDYGALLFATAAASPSVIQIRTEDIRPASAKHAVLFALWSTHLIFVLEDPGGLREGSACPHLGSRGFPAFPYDVQCAMDELGCGLF
jgi:predicted nuclease of predicted toxin-antitoxin system